MAHKGSVRREEWNRASELFLDLADLERSERERRLEELAVTEPELVRSVRALLAHDRQPEPTPFDSTTQSGSEDFGPYRSVRRIGEGGMGEVFLARRIDGEFDREVAIKRLHPSTHTDELLQRFLRERQTLAQLDHEYIARLIDGGSSEDGRPYLVLEYVEGLDIDAYCREQRLDARSRIQLFVKVLRAVEYAHECGVVHRDLKPSNILVRDDGTPRLLDFGIARAVQQDPDQAARLTATGQRLFTPEYASPEQVRGEPADERSDLFSLGVVLYRLLCDASPWGSAASLHELERRIVTTDPVAPSRHLTGTARRALSGDLDILVMSCLAKRPAERLESVAEFADELERYLSGLPIRTRATSLARTSLRYIRRRPWQALLGLAAIAALLAGLQAGRLARLAEDQQVELLDSLAGRVAQARVLRGNDHLSEAKEVLESVLQALPSLPDQPQLEIDARVELCRVLLRERRDQQALSLIGPALELRPEDPSVWPSTQADLLVVSTSCLRLAGDPADAASAASEAYEYTCQWLPQGHDLRLEAMTEYAGQVGSELRLEERLEILDEALVEAEERGDPRDRNIGSIQILRGRLFESARRYEECLECYDIALEIARWHLGVGHGDVALMRDARGTVLRRMRKFEDALVELEAAFEIFEVLGHEEKAAETIQHIGELHRAAGDPQAALDELFAARDRFEELLGPDHKKCRESDLLLGLVHLDIDQWEQAVALFEAALASEDGVVSLAWGYETEARFALARSLRRMGQEEASRAQAQTALELQQHHRGPNDPTVRVIRRFLE